MSSILSVLCVCNDSFICVTWLILTCDMTRSHVWYDSPICVPWLHYAGSFWSNLPSLLYVCAISPSWLLILIESAMTPLRVCHDFCVSACNKSLANNRDSIVEIVTWKKNDSSFALIQKDPYGVATISRLPKNIALLLQKSSIFPQYNSRSPQKRHVLLEKTISNFCIIWCGPDH